MNQICSPSYHFRKNSLFNGQQASFFIVKYKQSKSIKEVQRAFRRKFYPKAPRKDAQYLGIHKNFETFHRRNCSSSDDLGEVVDGRILPVVWFEGSVILNVYLEQVLKNTMWDSVKSLARRRQWFQQEGASCLVTAECQAFLQIKFRE